MAKEQDFYKKVAETLIEKMEQGVAPWQKSWNDGGVGRFPMNPTTGKRYRGGNILYLMAQDRDDPRWMTFRQAAQEGAQVKKGEHGTPVIYWKFDEQRTKKDENGKPVLDAEGKPVKVTAQLERPRAFVSYVFNAEQIDGLPELNFKADRTWEPVERAEGILEKSGAQIEHRTQPRAFYSLLQDKITLPAKEQFSDASRYYDTALHELGHWTGHESRLNRDMMHPFGSMEYAREELRAEISSMMVSGEVGLPHNTDNHAAYVQSWIQALRDDPKEIFRAAADAEKILEYVMALEQKQELAQEIQQAVPVAQTEPAQQDQAHSQDAAPRTYLHVAFVEKNAVKELGAKWDRQERSWYVPAGSDVEKFSRWLSPPAEQAEQQTIAPETQKSSTERRYLAVPYTERKLAKAAGAKWDSEAKSWYVGKDADMAKVQKWMPSKAEEQTPAMPPREEFAAVLRDLGLKIEGEYPIMDGKPHRVAVDTDKPGEVSGFYVGYLDGRPAGFAQNNRSGEEIRWKSAGAVPTAQEQEAFREQCAVKKQERAAELLALHEKTALRVQYQLSDLQPATEPTPYMQAKGIQPHFGAFLGKDGTTCLPAQDAAGKLWTMQYIQADGTKRFAKDGRKEGCFHAVGGTDAVRNAQVLVIAEGYATAATLSEALTMPTVAAFDAGNVVSVAKALHEKYPDKTIVIAGDDDRHHETGNPGREKATLAAKSVGGLAVFPTFAPGESGKDFSDFNDLAVKSQLGAEAVKRQVSPVIDKAVALKQSELTHQKEQQRGLSR